MSGLVSDDLVTESVQQLSLEKAFRASKSRQDGPGSFPAAVQKCDAPKSTAAKAKPKPKSCSFFEKFKKQEMSKTEDCEKISDKEQEEIKENFSSSKDSKNEGIGIDQGKKISVEAPE